MDHTADIGIEVEAPDMPELLRRAALGTLWMVLGRLPGESEGGRTREVHLETDDAAALLRAWLREVLYWQEVEGFAVTDLAIGELSGGRLRATATGVSAPLDPVREIKGVTWHGLRVEPTGPGTDLGGEAGWFARVVFDV